VRLPDLLAATAQHEVGANGDGEGRQRAQERDEHRRAAKGCHAEKYADRRVVHATVHSIRQSG
jgi:hypothetical protein